MGVMNKDRINVLWDIENCAVPNGVAPHQIAENIRNALASVNLHGSIVLSAFGDVQMHSKSVQQALADTNIYFKNIPNDRKEAADKAIIVDIFLWALDNPSPAHLFLISGDRDFSNALHGLKNRRYNVLLAAPSGVRVSQSLTGAASTIWDWGKLAGGQFVTLKQSDFAHDPTRALPQAPVNLTEAVRNPVASAAANHVRNVTNQTSNRPSTQVSNYPKQPTILSGPGPGHLKASKGSKASDPVARAQPGPKTATQPLVRKPVTAKVYAVVHNTPEVEGPAPEAGRQGFVGITKEHKEVLQLIMDSLRVDAVMPTMEHMHCRFDQVAERLRGHKMHPQSPEFESLLHAALTQGILERAGFRTDSGSVYFMRGAPKWKYQDPLDVANPYDPPVWDALHTCFQRDSETKIAAVLKCESRLQAAELIQSRGPPPLSTLPVGELVHLLQLAARVKWIVMEDLSSRMWQPIRYDLPAPTPALQGLVVTPAPGEKRRVEEKQGQISVTLEAGSPRGKPYLATSPERGARTRKSDAPLPPTLPQPQVAQHLEQSEGEGRVGLIPVPTPVFGSLASAEAHVQTSKSKQGGVWEALRADKAGDVREETREEIMGAVAAAEVGKGSVGGKIEGPKSRPTSSCTTPLSVKPPLKPVSSESVNTDGDSVAKTAMETAPGLTNLLHATLFPVVPPEPVSFATNVANVDRAGPTNVGAVSDRVPVKSTGSRSEVAVNVELEFRRWLAQSFGSKGKLRGGVVLGSLMSLFKAASGLAVDWKSWGFPRASVFLQEYPDLILVSTSPSPGKVVPATCQARIDLEALLGQVVPAGGKQGLPLDLFVADFRNEFQYPLERSFADLRKLRISMESMTQLVEVRKEGTKAILYQASGAATWRFPKTRDAVCMAGKGPETKPGPVVVPNPNLVRVLVPGLIPSTPPVESKEKKGPIHDVAARGSVGDMRVGKAVNVELIFRKWLAQSFGSKGKHRLGMAMTGMMGRFKEDSGYFVNWGNMGFPKFAKFLEMYPDLIQVITKPPPGRVVPAGSEARIDLEALLGKVLPNAGKVGMPLDRFTGGFRNEFGYPISTCLKDHKNVLALLESMTQSVFVRKEGKVVVLHEARGAATWRFHARMGVAGQVEVRSGLGLQGGGEAGRSGQQEVALVGRRVTGGERQISQHGTGTPEGSLEEGVGTESGSGEDSRTPTLRSESEGDAAGDVSGEHGERKSEATYEAEEELGVEGEGEGGDLDGDGEAESESDSVGWEGSVSTPEEIVEEEDEENMRKDVVKEMLYGVRRCSRGEEVQEDLKEVVTEEVGEGGGDSDTLAAEEKENETLGGAETGVERKNGNEVGRWLIEAVETESAAARTKSLQDKRGTDVEREGKGGGVEGRVEVGKGLAVLLPSPDGSGSGDLALMMSTGGMSGVREAETPGKGFLELFGIFKGGKK